MISSSCLSCVIFCFKSSSHIWMSKGAIKAAHRKQAYPLALQALVKAVGYVGRRVDVLGIASVLERTTPAHDQVIIMTGLTRAASRGSERSEALAAHNRLPRCRQRQMVSA